MNQVETLTDQRWYDYYLRTVIKQRAMKAYQAIIKHGPHNFT